MNKAWMLAPVLALAGVLAGADAFYNGSTDEPTWADTPNGRFECQLGPSTGHRQILTFNGKLLYQQPEFTEVEEGPTVATGIWHQGVGCPWVIDSRKGYIVITRDIQPPSHGVEGYAIIDTHRPMPTLVELGTTERSGDQKIPQAQRLAWREDGLMLVYVGYQLGLWDNSPGAKTAKRKTWYDFKSGTAKQAK